MELKEYLKILKKHKALFFGVAVAIPVATLLFFLFRPVSYSTSLTLDITRSGVQDSADYKYDDFYRLQADEKFAETVVEWLGSPRIEEDIFKKAGIDAGALSLKKLSNSIAAEKRSSQMVAVSFSSPDEKTARNIASSVKDVISQEIADLNTDQKESTWFEIKAQEPVIRMYHPSVFVFPMAFAAGIFFGFFIVLGKHYLED